MAWAGLLSVPQMYLWFHLPSEDDPVKRIEFLHLGVAATSAAVFGQPRTVVRDDVVQSLAWELWQRGRATLHPAELSRELASLLLQVTGACTGSGIGPTRIDRVIGILKAYTTRVGSGPFPTELLDDDGEKLRRIGHEVGVTTGRDRRCGWFDAVIARYATRVNGFTDYFLTKLDVLTGWEHVPVCVAYDVDGVRHDEMPMTQTDLHHATPIYEFLDGWETDLTVARTFEDLPKNTQRYVLALEEMAGARISAVGVGPDRDATIVRHDLLG